MALWDSLLAIFLVVGGFLFGFKLDSAVDKLRDSQEKIKLTEEATKTTQEQLVVAKKDLEFSVITVRGLKDEVDTVLAQAKSHLEAISAQRKAAIDIVIAMGNQRQLTEEGKAQLADLKIKNPDKFRPGVLGQKLWRNGSTIRIRFLDGSQIVHEKVNRFANEWTTNANIIFDFGDSPDAEIRVSFKESGSWSYKGTDCLVVPTARPTMNFGWLTEKTSDEETRAVVQREFGHALGLINEHQQPKANIQWNKEAMSRILSGPPNYYSPDMIDEQLFHQYSSLDLPDYRDFDPQSIMMLQIPKEWTLNGFEAARPMKLSASDKLLIAKIYPR
jgi:hypothetical protein